MSSNGSTAPGVAYSVDLTVANQDKLSVTCGGNAIFPSVTDLGEGKLRIEVAGVDIVCPGPLKFQDDGVTIWCLKVEPCPDE